MLGLLCHHGVVIRGIGSRVVSNTGVRITTTDLPKALKRDSIYNIDVLF